MAVVKPFSCIRPTGELVDRIAALPYDVYNRSEAKEEVTREPLSFLSIDRAETSFDDSVDTYDDRVYQKAKELLSDYIAKGYFIKDDMECYYLYELIMNGRSQTGFVACASIDDYQNNIIKKHEKTRADKELDRIRHVDTCNAQTGPIFLSYPSNEVLHDIMMEAKVKESIYSFRSKDGITHNVWRIDEDGMISRIKDAFSHINHIYIADGHHRAASAVAVGNLRREQNKDYDGSEEFNYFLSVFFPEDELMILPYNRVVRDLNGYSVDEFIEKVKERFYIGHVDYPYEPDEKGSFGMHLDNKWYKIKIKEDYTIKEDPVKALDVSILQDNLLEPILGILDPRVDNRIDFIGGIRGIKELEKRVATDMEVAFSMYPTTMRELFKVSDENKLMPPKSTWFEPKLRSGLFIHSLE